MIAVLALLLFAAPRVVWIAACAVCATVAAFEWARLTQLGRPATAAFIGLTALPVASWPLVEPSLASAGNLFLGITAFWLILVPFWLWRHAVPKAPAFSFVAGVLVIGSASLAAVALRDAGSWLLLCVMGVVWLSDSMAYFVGSAIGRHKLAPRISPGKTWEGAAGALVSVVIYALAWGYLSSGILPERYTAGPAAWLALTGVMSLLAVMGIYGDLFESFLKRASGVKDSGSILPGHGGALDRIDALLPVLPLAAWLFAR